MRNLTVSGYMCIQKKQINEYIYIYILFIYEQLNVKM